MGITLDDLLNIQPSKVSRDLNGYITYLFGPAKIGKTTFAKDMGALILECERGTDAMSGALDMQILSWSDIKTVARLCKDPKMKEKYKAIAVDTVDVVSTLCEKYVCSNNDVDSLGQIPYGQGWSLFKKEFSDTFRSIALQGYAVLFISHDKDKTITERSGKEYNKVCATVSESINKIVKDMSDIICYAYQDPDDNERYLMLRSLDGTVDVGCRFKYIKPKIKFGYNYLVEALNEAIDKEEQVNGPNAVTNEKKPEPVIVEYNYEDLMKEFSELVGILMNKDKSYYAPRITQTVEKILGKGKKFNDCSIGQTEQMALIIEEIKALT